MSEHWLIRDRAKPGAENKALGRDAEIEWQLINGRRIVSRHETKTEAKAALAKARGEPVK